MSKQISKTSLSKINNAHKQTAQPIGIYSNFKSDNLNRTVSTWSWFCCKCGMDNSPNISVCYDCGHSKCDNCK